LIDTDLFEASRLPDKKYVVPDLRKTTPQAALSELVVIVVVSTPLKVSQPFQTRTIVLEYETTKLDDTFNRFTSAA
jgi:hypothetical protein